MKILLFGGNGQVGTELRRSLVPLGDIIATTRSGRLYDGASCERADFDAPEALVPLIERIAPDIVVNAAAYTAVDRAEDDVAAAFRANAEAPRAIAAACAARDALLVHYSTDYVFDGQATRPYREDDPVAPLGVYGTSKLAGEEAIRASGAHHLIFRTAWVYAAHGRNFLRTMLRLAAERDELRVVADQVGSPTPAGLIADTTMKVLAQEPERSGLWHLTTTGQVSWHGFAQAIVEGAHARGLLDRLPRVIPIATADYPTAAARPANSVLDTSKLQQDFNLAPGAWQDGLGETMDAIVQAGRR
jgi:dTDP-4-dehydrorhamnose reductase